MNRERWLRVEEIFHAALEQSDEERATFVADACDGDTRLQDEVVALLAYDDPNTSFIERPALEALGAESQYRQAAAKGSDTAEATLLSDTPPDTPHAGDELPTGHQIQNFRIVRKIGAGGMGEVYLAENLRLGRRVALKLLPGSLHVSGKGGRRYLREARAASALNHRNIVTIYNADEADGLSFIEMEYIEGESLRERLLRGPLDVREVIALGLQAADAAAAAHAINIVHRDLKPGNILLTASGQAKVVDFGLAKVADAAVVASGGTSAAALAGAVSLSSVSLSQAGSISGTVPYMSPEQTRGEHVDARSDIFSLGCVLYEAATGSRPFDGTVPAEIIHKIRETEPPRPSVARPGLPRALDTVILRALAKDKEQRYRTAMNLAADLRRVKTRVAARRFLRRIRVPAVVVTVLVAGLLAWDHQRRVNVQRAHAELLRVQGLIDESRFFEAYDLAQHAARYVPDDPILAEKKPEITDVLSVTTDPPGAGVFLTRYQPDVNGKFPPRQRLGETPLKGVEIARGDYLLQIEKPGYEAFQRMISSKLGRIENPLWIPDTVRHSDLTQDASGKYGIRMDSDAPIEIDATLHREGAIPERMAQVPGGDYDLVAWDRPTEKSVPLDPFFIDQCEVTNREFEEFIAAGGYGNRSYWKVPLVDHDPVRGESRELSWENAMEVLRQPGRKGPASWPRGRCPAGKAEHPVTNVCWYEAAAYAEFRGKSLPTIYQWEHAARGAPDEKRWTVYWSSTKPWGLVDLDENLQYRANVMSALVSDGTTPVGSYPFGISPYGCYDMCGNVTEWCLNARPGGFTTTGASWHDGPNLFAAVGEYPGFFCAETLGFRCVLNSPGATGDQGGMPFPSKADEVPEFEPVSEEKFPLLRSHYEYVRPPANPLDATVIEELDAPGWRRLKIRYVGAEGQRTGADAERTGSDAPRERLGLAYLWLPKSARPPYQVINYKPGGPSYQGLFVWQETEVVCGPFILAGRAVFVALIQGMRERDLPPEWEGPKPDTIAYRDMMVYDTVDQRRGLDYLATRDDIDMERIACMGLSLGGYDLVAMAVEERFHATILVAAGLSDSERSVIAEANPVNFAPYIKGPKLMIHGRYDEGVPLRTAGQPLYDLLSEPKDDFVVLPTGHFPPMDSWPPYVEAFLDRLFGPVKSRGGAAGVAQSGP